MKWSWNLCNITRLKNRSLLVSTLDGGEQQKVAIAMALLQEPEILLCDEISSALDTNSEKEIFYLLNKLRETTKYFYINDFT